MALLPSMSMRMEWLWILLLLVLLLILLAVLVAPVLAIIALVKLRSLGKRIDKLEHREQPTIETEPNNRLQPIIIAKPVKKPEQSEIEQPPKVAKARSVIGPAISLSEITLNRGQLESFIGRRVLAWVAAGLLVLAASFFLNYAFQSQMIGPAGQIAIVSVIGLALCGWGYQRFTRGGRITSQLLTGIGLFILFLAIYGSFSLYRLLTPFATGLLLSVLMAEASLLAALYRSRVVAFISIVGALLTPLLIQQRGDPYLGYFLYLFVFNVAVAGLYEMRQWLWMRTLALSGTQLLFWIWFGNRYHPDKMEAVIAFQLCLAAVYLIPDWISRRRKSDTIEDWGLQVVLPWFLFLSLYRVLAEFHPSWMGVLALGTAMVWMVYALLFTRFTRSSYPVRRLIFFGTVLAFIGLAFPLHAKAYWAVVGWTIEGVALWWLGLRIRNIQLRVAGAVFLALAGFGSIHVMMSYAPEKPYLPIINIRTLPLLAVMAGFFAAAWCARMFQKRLTIPDSVMRYGTGLAGIGLGWLLLSIEVWDWTIMIFERDNSLESHTALSFAWGLYAGVLLSVGFKLQHSPTRWTALGLFAITLFKLLFYDLSELEGIYRVLTFLMGAVVLALAAIGYRWIQLTSPTANRTEDTDD